MPMIKGGERWSGRYGKVVVFPFGGIWFTMVKTFDGMDNITIKSASKSQAIGKFNEEVMRISKGRVKDAWHKITRRRIYRQEKAIDYYHEQLQGALEKQKRYDSGEEVEEIFSWTRSNKEVIAMWGKFIVDAMNRIKMWERELDRY